MTVPKNAGKALLMMGCPEVPVQMSVVLYLASRLRRDGWDVVVAGTTAALKLLEVSDTDRYYVRDTVVLERCIEDVVEGRRDFDVCFAFIHSDAGVTFAATMASISEARMYALIFGKNAEALADTVQFECEKVVAKAVHNPGPLKNRLDKVMGW